MDLARISELLQPFLGTDTAQQPDDTLCHNISTYIDILLRWNARINLTAIRNPEEIVTRHFGESLFAARHLFPGTSSVPALLAEALSEAGALPVSSVVKGLPRLANVGSG